MGVQPCSENDIAHRSELNRGGRFAAMEAPNLLLLGGVRKFFRGLR